MVEQGPLSNRVLGGKYLLGDLLGEGGFGVVYKALNQSLNRPQAVKVLLEKHLRDPKFHQRFIREAQTLAALDHPHIVHVDELGEEPDLIYLVMPYISGGTLQDLLKAQRGPLEVEEVLRYLEHICSALGYAHAHGIAHLDLKPLNLLVHQDGRLLLSDFGLAHLMEQGTIEGGTSLQFGSPLYMAPEHFEGKPTQQSDLYALGVIVYQMLTGRHPFEASTPAAVMRKHLTEPPPPLHTARPDLPVALDAVIAKALAKQSEQRYGRAGELLFDFRAALGGQALQFAGAAEPTRVSQVYLDPTQQVTHPPTAPGGPTLVGSGSVTLMPGDQPLVPPPPPSGYGPPPPPPGFYGTSAPRATSVLLAVPAAPGKLNIWTRGFKRLFALAGAGGLLFTLVGFFGVMLRAGTVFDFSVTVSDIMILLAQGGLFAVALVGMIFVKSRLVRVSLILLLVSTGSALIASLLTLYNDVTRQLGNGFLSSLVLFYLPLLSGALAAVSLVCLSYRISRWQAPLDLGLSALQVLLAGAGLWWLLNQFPFPNLLGIGENPVLEWSGVALVLLAVMILLIRPAAWKQSPVVIVCLVVGAIFLLLHLPGGFHFLSLVLRPADTVEATLPWLRELYSLDVFAYVPLILGFLLLIQMERVRKRTQQVEADPVLAGQKL